MFYISAQVSSADQVIGSVVAVDPDTPATTVACSIISGNTGTVFKMHTDNKEIRTKIAIDPDKPTSKA